MRKVVIALLLAAVADLSHASYCGQSAIPFRFEVLRNGQPNLGCARPTCFGWTSEGQRSADSAQFYKISGQMDGFLRQDAYRRGPVMRVADTTTFQPQYSVCNLPRYY